jgi:hypothetical protein
MRTISRKLLLVKVSLPWLDYLEDQLEGGPLHRSLSNARTPSQRLGYQLPETFIVFDSVGRNETYSSGGLDSGLCETGG